MSSQADQSKRAVWAMVATIAPQPIYRPEGLTERDWARRQLKYLPSGTDVYWLPYFKEFFYRRETDYSECYLDEPCAINSKGFLRIATYHPKITPMIGLDGTPSLEQKIGLIWLRNWRVRLIHDPHLVNLMMKNVWRLWNFSQGDLEREEWLKNWAASDEAREKLEEAIAIIQSWQQERR